MIPPLSKLIDWPALQLAYTIALRAAPESKWKLEESLEFLNGPDFMPIGSEPAQVEFAGPRNFRFATPLPGKDEENNIVYGRLYRCAERWQERPVIVLLDGKPAVGYHTAFPWLARRFNGAGFNVVTVLAPHDLQRRPRRPIEWNCLDLAQAIAQHIAEIRALTGWLLDEGCLSVGLLGISFGGWVAGLTACCDTRIASAVLTVPAVRMTRFSPPVFWRRTFHALRPAHEAMDATRLNLLLSRPVMPKEDILLIEAIHDLFAEAQPIEELWQTWQQPEIWRLPHGHISWVGVRGLTGRVLDWLSPRLVSRRKSNA